MASEQRADCCVVGAGPAGMLLALALARRGLSVALLEAHQDFERAFRGDSLHPSGLEVLEGMGLLSTVLPLAQSRIARFTISGPAAGAPRVISDMRRLPTRYPFVAMVPQARMLALLAEEARETLALLMGAHADGLVVEGGAVCGVRFRGPDGGGLVRAPLTVAADGRHSRVRHMAGLAVRPLAAPIDVLWLSLPRLPGDPADLAATVRVARGSVAVVFDRGERWQVGAVVPKGGYRRIREAGMAALRCELAATLPELADQIDAVRSWGEVAPLSVVAGRAPRWYRPGLLLIGDAAHPMSPVGGVGVNYAMQDAAVAAEALAGPLAAGQIGERELRRVQRLRGPATALAQAMQELMQSLLLPGRQPDSGLPAALELYLRLPPARGLATRVIALGLPHPGLPAGRGQERQAR